MGTAFTVDAIFSDRSGEDGLHDVVAACQILHEVDQVFSTWRADTPISRLRRGELAEQDLPQQVEQVLASCVHARELSGGWFDPWAAPGGVDPTGYVKGWAGQLVLDSLRARGAQAALVNAAGDVVGFGGPEPGRPWVLGLTNPFALTELLGSVPVEDGALAVSGTYERGDHVFDPSGRPAAAGVISAAVLGPDLGMADALATALVAGGQEALDYLAGDPTHRALVIFTDGRQVSTGAFPLRALPGTRRPQAS
jgi:thiamine biosynthesis lipoprotein